MKALNYVRGFVAGSWTLTVGLTCFILGIYAEYKMEKDSEKKVSTSASNKYVNYSDYKRN